MSATGHLSLINLVIMAILLTGSGICLIRDPKNRRAEGMLVIVVFAFVARFILASMLSGLCHVVHVRLDQYVYVFDYWLGEPSFHVGRFLNRHALIRSVSATVYNSPYTAFLLLMVMYYKTQTETTIREMLKTFLICLCLAPLEYIIFPVSGPGYAFPMFPNVEPVIQIPHVLTTLTAPPNGVPSIHMSLALLLCYFAQKWRWAFVGAGVFAVFTVLATLGIGEHYVFDLLMAVPHSILCIVAARESAQEPIGLNCPA